MQNVGEFAFPVVFLVLTVVLLAAYWKMFVKAGQPGWAAIIPIYNIIVWLKVAGKPWWWIVLLLIPVVNLVMSLLVSLSLAKAFGRSNVFGILALWLFPVGYLMLGFGNAEYIGTSSNPPQTPQIPVQPQPQPQVVPAQAVTPTQPPTA